jgi:Putative zinc-finger
MKSISTKELQRLLSLYLDGALDPEEKERFEEYLANNPDAALELQRWKRQQQLLQSKPGVTPNEWFWPQLSARLNQQKASPETVYPFSRKYVPLAAALTVLIAAFGGVILFQQRALLTKYFSEKKEQVQQIYQGNILQGKLMPLFTNLDKDQVLQFALFGTLPVDAQAKTALRVDESKENGTRIEFAKNEARDHPHVTVAQFCKDIDATPDQFRSVDSILSTARDKIEQSVFLGENKSLAVHADLATFNRTMMSNIAASLELPQRRKFKRYLAVSGSPYTFVIASAPQAPVPAAMPRIPRPPRMEQFVVITPDSCSIARVNINVQQILRNETMTTQEIRVMNERTRSLIRDFAEHTRGQRRSNSSLRVFSGSDYFSIKVEDNALEPQPSAMPFEVIARAPKAVQFQYEMHQMPGVPKIFDEEVTPPDQPLQNTSSQPGEWKQNSEQGRKIDLDSVISAPRDRKARPQSNQNKKRYENPFEL